MNRNKNSNKISISPTARDILWILEEAGSETITCIINTLIRKKDDCAPEDILEKACDAIKLLLDLKWVTSSKKELVRIINITDHINWDRSLNIYAWNNDVNTKPPEIQLTEDGMKIFEKP